MAKRASRRSFMKATALAGAAGEALTGIPGTALAAPAVTMADGGIYARLGVRPLINGVGVVTHLGGSLMPPEVVRAMEEASRSFVQLNELQKRVGARIAELLGAEAAMVTSGCAAAITMGTTACVTRGIPENLKKIPDTTGMKNEIIQQRAHRGGYEQQMWLVGAKTVWVETREELDKAINDRTAMMFFYNEMEPFGKIKRQEWIKIGKERGIPTFQDAAADTPPVGRLTQYIKEGFDLVAFSGGKALRGPQCSGFLMGRKELIDAAIPGMSPYAGIARGNKVGKEEMVGLLAAIERFLTVDHDQEMKELESRAAEMMDGLKKVKGLTVERYVPEIANVVPHVLVSWSEDAFKMSTGQVTRQLMAGDPPIAVSGFGERKLKISVWMMRPGEHRIVTNRLLEVFGA